jgi:hypothetical protein
MPRFAGLVLGVTALLAVSGCASDPYYAYDPYPAYNSNYYDGQYSRDRDYYLREYYGSGSNRYYQPPY